MGRKRIILTGAEETVRLGSELATTLPAGTILALQGDLGAGKTTFVQGLLNGLNIQDTAQSPTFTYLQIYQSPSWTVYHFDLYRLTSEKDFLLLGFDEFLKPREPALIIIEWPERIASLLPLETNLVSLSHHELNRRAEITIWGQRAI